MQNTRLSRVLSCILCIVLFAAMALCTTACSDNQPTPTPDTSQSVSDVNVLGEGTTVFDLKVTDEDGSSKAFEIHTDKETVGEALVALGLIEGEDSQYGLYIKKVAGITADFDVDGTYWAFYVNGEYVMSGVDTTAIQEGDTYELRRQK